MAKKRIAPHLAIGDDVEARVLLERDGFLHGAVLDPFEGRGCQLTALEFLTSVEECGRTEEAADDVASRVHIANEGEVLASRAQYG